MTQSGDSSRSLAATLVPHGFSCVSHSFIFISSSFVVLYSDEIIQI